MKQGIKERLEKYRADLRKIEENLTRAQRDANQLRETINQLTIMGISLQARIEELEALEGSDGTDESANQNGAGG